MGAYSRKCSVDAIDAPMAREGVRLLLVISTRWSRHAELGQPLPLGTPGASTGRQGGPSYVALEPEAVTGGTSLQPRFF
jgi:hypothetical protein